MIDILAIIKKVVETKQPQIIPYTPENKKACSQVYKAHRRFSDVPRLSLKTRYKRLSKEPEFIEVRLLANPPQRLPTHLIAEIQALEIGGEIALPVELVKRSRNYANSINMRLLEHPSLRSEKVRVYYFEGLIKKFTPCEQ